MTKPKQNFVFQCRSLAVAVLALAFAARAEDEPKLEELFPETTLVSIALPNLDAARKAADASRIGAMLKEPEMREFLDPLVSRMKEVYADARAANPMIPGLDELDGALLSGEIGISLYSRGVGNEPGVVVSIKPKDEKAFDAMLNTAFKPLLQGQPFPKDAFPLGNEPDAPGLVYARGRLIFCKPMQDLAAIADRVGDANKRMTGSLAGSASFKEAHAGMKDPAGWIYLNAAAMLQLADEVMAARADPGMMKFKTVLSALGVDKLSAVMAGFTFAGGEAALETYVGMADGGAPKGIFALIGSKPVSSEMLQIAAADTPYVAAGSANIAQIMP
ncbi:MAG TPA: hypothetical protein VKX17_17110, partial [Planctomycetota bacterium]|nr:hypothetical protein [Planctomycetota bacterium]